MMLMTGAVITFLVGAVSAVPHAAIKRQVSQLRDHYDFVVAGGGTSGLTVADRLSEAFPDKTVLVVEYGDIEYAPGIFDPPLAVWGGVGASASYFIVQSLPLPDVKNKTAFVLAGKVVGGSSAINGMFFDRPSRHDLDAWASVASPQLDSSQNRWGWSGLYPFFKKSVTFTAPPAAVAQTYGYTWDTSVYSGSTPIYSSFPPFLWADHHLVRNAWADMDVPKLQECAGGNKAGLCWIPISQHPVTARRSHAGLGHYAAVNATRSNYDLIVKHQVTRVIYPNGSQSGPPMVELRSLANNQLFNITASAEVIISAGAFHTPTILQRSGIGRAALLSTAGISITVDLPGVGSNFQDHSGPGISWAYTKPGNFSPLPSSMSDPAFVADAVAGFGETPARGPYTLANSNSAIFVPLGNMSANSQTIISRIKGIVADGSAASYLPADYRDDATMVAGYNKQLAMIAKLLSDPRVPSMESTFATGTSVRAVHLHPLSRGTVRLNLTDTLQQPIVNYGTGSNPIDFDIYLAHLKYLRAMVNTTTLRKYGAVEVSPGNSTQTDAALLEYIKDQLVLSFMHPCCTAAMLPRQHGGVVGTDLKVHGAAGLRVVDMSVLPFLPSSHLSSVAYAVGEKAADLIIQDWS
ncbi:GMC oxidoreductase-like protein [Lasiosphaeria hispida]|uniref:GMC oxidoreductase-like protein n=1 Tax=Lasiosphaeria hispida TaxID=260671 RepID=A0AAJ0HE54_9PEZI|nr:GMC oxidoreductase-like protein [Lasiosphaeria hispida]